MRAAPCAVARDDAAPFLQTRCLFDRPYALMVMVPCFLEYYRVPLIKISQGNL